MRDALVLEPLVDRLLAAAALPVQGERKRLWADHQALRPTPRIPVCVYYEGIPEPQWEAMLGPEALRCRGALARSIEGDLRRTLWMSDNVPDDHIVWPSIIVEAVKSRDEGFAVYKKIESIDGKPLADVKAGSLVAVTLEIVVPKESLFVVVDDPLPAGFEAVNAGLRTESEERQRDLDRLGSSDEETPWWSGFNHIEMRDDRVLLFADSLATGVHRFRYLARALTSGTFALPGAKTEEMYAPEVFGRSAEAVVKIVK